MHDFPIPLNTKFCSICYHSVVFSMSKYGLQAEPTTLVWWLKLADRGSKMECTNWNVNPTFVFDFYTHIMSILHRLATIHNAADRQDRQQGHSATGIIRPCSSIAGQKGKFVCTFLRATANCQSNIMCNYYQETTVFKRSHAASIPTNQRSHNQQSTASSPIPDTTAFLRQTAILEAHAWPIVRAPAGRPIGSATGM